MYSKLFYLIWSASSLRGLTDRMASEKTVRHNHEIFYWLHVNIWTKVITNHWYWGMFLLNAIYDAWQTYDTGSSLLSKLRTDKLNSHSQRHINVLRVSQCLCKPQFDSSPEPLALSVGVWRMSAKSSRCNTGICSTDNLLQTTGFLPELMAFLWQFYFLVEM